MPQVVAHTGIFAVGGSAAAIGASMFLPTRSEAGPDGYARTDLLRDASVGLTAGGLLLFTLTAGAQLATSGEGRGGARWPRASARSTRWRSAAGSAAA